MTRRGCLLLALVLGLPVLGLALCLPSVDRVHQAGSQRAVAQNDMKQVLLAVFDYLDTTGRLPPAAVYGPDNTPLLSWRVLVLPHLERWDMAEKGLSRQFKLNEPWDSPHNVTLLPKMPAVYGPPKGRPQGEPHTTFYRAFVGPRTLFEGRHGLPMTALTDDPAETFLFVEAGSAVPWTKPDELPYALDRPVPALGGMFGHGFHAAFADGTIRRIPPDASEATIRALITRNAGDKPGQDW